MNCPECRRHLTYVPALSNPPKVKCYFCPGVWGSGHVHNPTLISIREKALLSVKKGLPFYVQTILKEATTHSHKDNTSSHKGDMPKPLINQ